jgi:hypothetical protein
MSRVTYTVSGPGVDRSAPENPGAALSVAISVASKREAEPGSYYVRRSDEQRALYRVERAENGALAIYTNGGIT